MLTYTKIEINNVLKNIDTTLRELEARADAIGYPIENNTTYLYICEVLTSIEWGDISPDLTLWISLGKDLQSIEQDIKGWS